MSDVKVIDDGGPAFQLAAIERIGGNDLLCSVECNCPDSLFADSPKIAHLFKRKVRLHGYDDANFWCHVAGVVRTIECVCGRSLEYRWTPQGVEYRWQADAMLAARSA